KLGNVVCLARDVGDVVAGFLEQPLLAVHRASPPAHVLGGLLDLLFPGHAEQPVHPLVLQHAGNRRHERRFVGDLPFPPPSGGCRGRRGCLPLGRPFSPPCGLLVGRQGGPPHQPPFAPFQVAVRRTTGSLQLIALGCKPLVPPVIGTPYPL